MRLIYIYIRKFRNIVNQEVYFSDKYTVKYNPELPFPSALTIFENEQNTASSIIYRDSQLSNVHLIVGKTGAGKTNILQLIGMPEKERISNSDGASYFLLYAAEDYFVIEPLDIPISYDLRKETQRDSLFSKMPNKDKEYLRVESSMRMFKFSLENSKPVDVATVTHYDDLGSDLTFVFNGYERSAFPLCSYEKKRLNSNDSYVVWQPRENAEFKETALWNKTRFLKEYIDTFESDNIKRKVALVIKCNNWADSIKQHINDNLQKSDYWTYIDCIREEEEQIFCGKKVKKHKRPSIKKQFIHDLLTDYALYLREWVSYIEMWPDEIPEDHLDYTGTKDVYQEGIDYWYEKQLEDLMDVVGKDDNPIDPRVLPDYIKMPILKRLIWLSMWIDRKGEGNPYHLLWQISDDIKDISELLKKFDSKYFTNETFTLPIEDMFLEKNKSLVDELFERMEQYTPDDSGIFTEKLLPYSFTCLSSGEYQFANIMGGIDEFCIKLSLQNKVKPNLIYLLDEPETYMHPELCRTLLMSLDKVLKDKNGSADIQIIISTHSPFLLSDVLSGQVTRLDVGSKGYCIIKNGTEKAYFGSNIHTILADGFFLDFTMGEYARVFLQGKFDWLKRLAAGDYISEKNRSELNELKEIVSQIGDSFIKEKFECLIHQIEGNI